MTDNSTIKGVRGDLGLQPLLDTWNELVEKYSEVHRDKNGKAWDACYWHNERATLGILAAAAWKTDKCCALEEYLTTKRDPENPDYAGRCDLYLYTASGKVKYKYECEAKQSWQTFEEGKLTELKGSIKLAIAATKCLIPIKDYGQLALTFCVPSSKDNIDETYINDWLKNLKELSKSSNSIAYAWVFPESCRNLKSDIKGRIYPGVVLLIHEVEDS